MSVQSTCAVVGGHAPLEVPWKWQCTSQTRTSELLRQPCCSVAVWLMRVGIWSCLSIALEYKTAL